MITINTILGIIMFVYFAASLYLTIQLAETREFKEMPFFEVLQIPIMIIVFLFSPIIILFVKMFNTDANVTKVWIFEYDGEEICTDNPSDISMFEPFADELCNMIDGEQLCRAGYVVRCVLMNEREYKELEQVEV